MHGTSQPDEGAAQVLELRIHGVNNTSPPAMLDLPADSVDQVEGDDLGSFWRPTPAAVAELTPTDRGYVPPGIVREAYSWGGMARSSIGGASAVGAVLGAAGRLGWALLLPFGLVNVAYWTRRLDASAETGETGDPAPQRVTRSGAAAPDRSLAARLSRPTPTPGRLEPLNYRYRGGGALVRVAGLLITLATATTASVISLDYLAVQCFSGSAARCSSLPGWSGFLYTLSLPRRLALLSLAPLAIISFLMFLASRSRSRYERATRDQTYGPAAPAVRTPHAAQATPRWPLLSTPGFWNHSTVTACTARLHLSAVGLLVALATAWHMRFGTGGACGTVGALLGDACRSQAGRAGPGGSPLVIAAAALFLALVVALVVVHTEDAADVAGPSDGALSRWSAWLRSDPALRIGVYAGPTVFGVQTVLLLLDGATYAPPAGGGVRLAFAMVGVSALTNVLFALLFGLTLAGLTLRYVAGWVPRALGLTVAVTLLGSGADGVPGWIARVLSLGALLAVGFLVLRAQGGPGGPARRHEVWGGCGPGVGLALAQLLCLILSSGLVVGVGNVLNGTYPAASLAGLAAVPTGEADPCADACASAPEFLLSAPRPYVWLGAVLVVALAGVVLAFAAVVLLQWVDARRTPAARPGAASPEASDTAGTSDAGTDRGAGPDTVALPVALSEALTVPGDPQLPGDPRPPGERRLRGGRSGDGAPAGGPLATAIAAARALARHAHRAEPGTGLVAGIGLVTLGVALYASVGGAPPEGGPIGPLMGLGMWALTGVGALVVGLATGAGNEAGTRPLGLMWDLMCFLPRAGHPFGPPCYAERVVPELLGRYHWWLTEEGARGEDEVADSPRSIVVSAHSLGCVLAVATVLGAPAPDLPSSPVPRLALLTHGSQLRTYFSRFFPELLGPDVLGSPPCRAADLISADPWRTERAATPGPATASTSVAVLPGSVRRLLGGSATRGGRWVNLWRLTDYLGFPVHHYPLPDTGGSVAGLPPVAVPAGPGDVAVTEQDTAFDRYADEVDRTAYLLDVLAHSDYPRSDTYAVALAELTEPGRAPGR